MTCLFLTLHLVAHFLGGGSPCSFGDLQGIVLADGAPKEGVTVAVLPCAPAAQGPEVLEQVRWARTDGEGRFRFRLPFGSYFLSASHPDLEGLTVIRTVSPRPATARGEVLGMKPGAHTLEGRLLGPSGGCEAGLLLLAPLSGDLAPSETRLCMVRARAGGFRVALPEGRYAVNALVPGQGWMEGSLTVWGPKTRSDLRLLPLPSPAPPEVRAWIRSHALPLDTVSPLQPAADLEPLGSRMAGARVVGLGEASHGTRELGRLKHRLLAHLIERRGFTLLALEADPVAAQALDAFIREGRPDLRQAVERLGFWTGPEATFMELGAWLRAYNLDPRHPRKVRIHGIDLRAPQGAFEEVRRFLLKVDPVAARRMDAMAGLAPPRSPVVEGGPPLDLHRPTLDRLLKRMDARKRSICAKAGRTAFEHHRQLLVHLVQFMEIQRGGVAGAQARERAMAANLAWLLRRHPGVKAVVWAHNLHVAKAPRPSWAGIVPMGRHLEQILGRRYLAIGLTFHRGAFMAIPRGSPSREAAECLLPDPPPGTLEEALACADVPILALDLRELPARGAAARWFRTSQRALALGAEFDPGDPEDAWCLAPIRPAFDLLVSVDRAGPSKRCRHLSRTSARRGAARPPFPRTCRIPRRSRSCTPACRP